MLLISKALKTIVSQGQRSENNLMECRADQATQSKRRRQTKRRSQSAAGKNLSRVRVKVRVL